jgi:proteasome accessory factor C
VVESGHHRLAKPHGRSGRLMPAGTVEVRVRRLLAMLGWLSRQGAGTVAITELAERFGMTAPQVVAELELAACCGLPPYSPDQLMELMVDDVEVQADLGADLSRPRRLSAAEGFTLAASARAILAVPGADPEGALATALEKLEAALGQQAEVKVDLETPPLLEEVRSAVTRAMQVRITYYSAARDETSSRVVDPLQVFSSGGSWYLDAWCHQASDTRHFRVDRVESVEETGVIFDRRPTEAPPAAVVPGPGTPRGTVLLPPGAQWLVESLPATEVEVLEDGRVRAALPVSGEAWLARLLLRAGPGSEVVDPTEWREVGRQAARRVLARYTVTREVGAPDQPTV